jgi:hydroxyethylthiazole kinase-like uncharacterized protein yjeF
MRSAEVEAACGLAELMERAGRSLAEAALRFAGPMPALVLCGPGNNGGDGYVAARHLAASGLDVRVAALGEPTTELAIAARKQWHDTVEPFHEAAPAPLLLDCIFGTGLRRGLEEPVADGLFSLVGASRLAIAADLPSGVEADSGALLSEVPAFDLTVAFGALKPAHRLMPALPLMGRLVLADIGVQADGPWFEIGEPALPPVAIDAHKYSRGLVHCLAGEMPGAIALAASAAARSGAGYVRVSTSQPIAGLPRSVVQVGDAQLTDPRIGCILVGRGLRQAAAGADPGADQLSAQGDRRRRHRPCRGARAAEGQDAILTPHAGEFAKLFGQLPGSKAEQALAAAEASGAVIVFKGPTLWSPVPTGGSASRRPHRPGWQRRAPGMSSRE